MNFSKKNNIAYTITAIYNTEGRKIYIYNVYNITRISLFI